LLIDFLVCFRVGCPKSESVNEIDVLRVPFPLIKSHRFLNLYNTLAQGVDQFKRQFCTGFSIAGTVVAQGRNSVTFSLSVKLCGNGGASVTATE
jgi:hypothetical protein